MHPNPRRILPVILILALAGAALWYFFGRPASADTGVISASGTIEATQINISPELGGRATAVNAAEGATVRAGDVLVQLDTSLLEAQRAQAAAAAQAAQAAVSAAEAAHAAALANYELLKAGPSDEQLEVAQTVIDRARIAADAAREAYEALPETAQDTAQGKTLKTQWDTAEANLANAQAQYDLTKAGARPQQLEAAEAQVDAARAQVEAAQAQADAAQAALNVLDVQMGKLALVAPLDGVVLARSIEPGEMAVPGATLLVIADLGRLTLTVYVPEDRYGNIRLGQTATVTVDSFEGQTFSGTVTYIAGKAEFTPRNVQTAEGRRTTVFAVQLSIDNPEGKLKPGMPADVVFNQ